MSDRSIAAHLDIELPPNTPEASQGFTTIHDNAEKIYGAFEAASAQLPGLDDDLDLAVYQSRVPVNARRIEAARQTIRIYPPCIEKAEESCRDLETILGPLEAAARKEPKTIKGRAVLELDLRSMKKSLATTREMIEVAQNELENANRVISDAEGAPPALISRLDR
jgi:hypothetical protein